MALFTPSESPAVVVKEVDLTGGVPNVQTSTAAYAGKFMWGPANKTVLVSNELEFQFAHHQLLIQPLTAGFIKALLMQHPALLILLLLVADQMMKYTLL
jgi:hypothetical protein